MTADPERLVALHERFARAGDWALVGEIEAQLARQDIVVPSRAYHDEPSELEHAITKPAARRGRQPKNERGTDADPSR